MANEKKVFVKDICDNQQVDDIFLMRDMRMGETKAGKTYLSLQVMDKSGEITARVWDNAAELAPVCSPGSFVRMQAQAQSYKGEMQLRVVQATPVDPESVDLAFFLPATPCDIAAMSQEIVGFINSVDDAHIKALLLSIVNDNALWQGFLKAPAAKMMHHAYLGGLLEHTLGICRLADKITELYPSLDRSLLLAGVILHDIGKVREFTFDTAPFNYSNEGRLVGHMVISVEIVQQKIGALSGFPEQTAHLIKHLILSHHGRYEFGSPALPMTREAFVLNFIDDLDAKMNYLDKLSTQLDGSEYQWSDYQRNLERFLFIPGGRQMVAEDAPSPQEPESEPMVLEERKQPSLWG